MDKLELIAALEVERDGLLKKVKSLEDTILTLKQTISFDTSSSHVNGKGSPQRSAANTMYDKYRGYFDAKTNKEKAIAILKAEGRFLHMRQIVKIAQSLEPTEDADTVKSKISQGVYALKNLENPPVISKVIGGSNLNAFWGSKNWVDEKGNIKQQYMYDEKELSANKNEILEI